jgi:ubiquinone/menaquinone biosynthesis C-methylase UbiE
MMLDLAEIKTGSRVLDVGAGTGDQTVMAAQRVTHLEADLVEGSGV